MNPMGWAGYVPPPDDPYWCYQACIDPNYKKHNYCVKKCYSDVNRKKTSALGAKTPVLLLPLLNYDSVHLASAASACTEFNTQTRIAREAVKSLIALADIPVVEVYYGGVENNQNEFMVVNVQPVFKFTKDWYKVTIRNSDCRVMNASLFLENLPRE